MNKPKQTLNKHTLNKPKPNLNKTEVKPKQIFKTTLNKHQTNTKPTLNKHTLNKP